LYDMEMGKMPAKRPVRGIKVKKILNVAPKV